MNYPPEFHAERAVIDVEEAVSVLTHQFNANPSVIAPELESLEVAHRELGIIINKIRGM